MKQVRKRFERVDSSEIMLGRYQMSTDRSEHELSLMHKILNRCSGKCFKVDICDLLDRIRSHIFLKVL